MGAKGNNVSIRPSVRESETLPPGIEWIVPRGRIDAVSATELAGGRREALLVVFARMLYDEVGNCLVPKVCRWSNANAQPEV